MAKLLVRFLCLLSALFYSFAFSQETLRLGNDDLGKPEVVSAWLQKNGARADQKRAKEFFDGGVKAKKQQRWGPAGKSFGASALYYPTPQVLNEYANVKLHMLGEIRIRNKEDKRQSDLHFAVSIYRSVLAANTILKTMNTEEESHIRHNIACVIAYLDSSSKLTSDCPPLRIYGIRK